MYNYLLKLAQSFEKLSKIRSKTFDMRYFKRLSNPHEILEYAKETLEPMGSGSSRDVFLISSKYVVKIAKNTAGQSQNSVESEIGTDPDYKEIVAQVYDYNPSYYWLISELVNPLNSYSMDKSTGADEDAEFEKYYEGNERGAEIFQNLLSVDWDSFYNDISVTNEDEDEEIVKSPPNPNVEKKKEVDIAQNMIDKSRRLIAEYDLNSDDLGSPAQWGQTADGRVVLLDYGLNSDIWNNEYRNGKVGRGF